MNKRPEIYNQLVPYVIEQTGRGERGMDIYSRLLRERIIFIGTPIDDHIASLTIAQLIFLEAEDSEKDINLYINSPGGSVTAGLAIYDTMKYVKPDVSTICVGMAASMGAILLAGGAARVDVIFAARTPINTAPQPAYVLPTPPDGATTT